MSYEKDKQDNTPKTSVFQNHYGEGQNIGTQNVYQSISAASLQSTVEAIFSHLNSKSADKAADIHGSISETGNLDVEAKKLFSALEIRIGISLDHNDEKALDKINSILGSAKDELVLDVANHVKLLLLNKSSITTEAIKGIISKDYSGKYSWIAYWELFAEIDEIKDCFNQEKSDLTELELCSLIRGAIRLNNPYATEIANHLILLSNSFNTRVLHLLARVVSLNDQIQSKHIWLATYSEYMSVRKFSDDLIELINECRGSDNRLLIVANSLTINYAFGDLQELSQTAHKYVANIEQVDSEYGKRLRFVYDDPIDALETLPKLARASRDKKYKSSLIEDIVARNSISLDDSMALAIHGTTSSIQAWLKSGGTVDAESSMESDYAILELKTISATSDQSNDSLEKEHEKFCNDYSAKLSELSVPSLRKHCERLSELGLLGAIINLLKPLVATSDSWASPIVELYASALLNNNQYQTLHELLSGINRDIWSDSLWEIESGLHFSNQKYDKSIAALEEAIKLDANNLRYWFNLTISMRANESDDESIKKTLNKIPAECFDKSSGYGYKILSEKARVGEWKFVQKILLKWFVSSPEREAKELTDFYFQTIIDDKTSSEPELESSIGNCICGVEFLEDGKLKTKIIVRDASENSRLILENSRLGELLSKMEVGDSEEIAMRDITLKSKLPPLIAAFRVASEIRNELRIEGDNFFYSFELPEEPDEMVAALERKVRTGQATEEFYSKPDIPLYIKGYHYNRVDPIRSAFFHLTNPKSLKHEMPNTGMENCEELILDLFSIAYLSLSGLVDSLLEKGKKIFITVETKDVIEDWLKKISQDNWGQLASIPGRGLLLQSSEEFRANTSDQRKDLERVIRHAEIVGPSITDYSNDVRRVGEMLDWTILSTMKAAISSQKPWLCIDAFLVAIADSLSFDYVNVNSLVFALTDQKPIQNKMRGICLNVSANMPFPISYKDIFELSQRDDHDSLYCLSVLIGRIHASMPDMGDPVAYLRLILSRVLSNTYFNQNVLVFGQVEMPPSFRWIEQIFYACCNKIVNVSRAGGSAEERLAALLADLLWVFKEVENLTKYICYLASKYISGHFMSFDEVNRCIKKRFEVLGAK